MIIGKSILTRLVLIMRIWRAVLYVDISGQIMSQFTGLERVIMMIDWFTSDEEDIEDMTEEELLDELEKNASQFEEVNQELKRRGYLSEELIAILHERGVFESDIDRDLEEKRKRVEEAAEDIMINDKSAEGGGDSDE